ncbi:unnamed protein product [Periconia digitata]|uniref:ABC transporter domain-containing protein n=1 Tax=Periconia digitata TaxID=1303443 RepID=A0A9W4UJW4_9PLEO|nr:unnamed protein product [Periconia digitata]
MNPAPGFFTLLVNVSQEISFDDFSNRRKTERSDSVHPIGENPDKPWLRLRTSQKSGSPSFSYRRHFFGELTWLLQAIPCPEVRRCFALTIFRLCGRGLHPPWPNRGYLLDVSSIPFFAVDTAQVALVVQETAVSRGTRAEGTHGVVSVNSPDIRERTPAAAPGPFFNRSLCCCIEDLKTHLSDCDKSHSICEQSLLPVSYYDMSSGPESSQENSSALVHSMPRTVDNALEKEENPDHTVVDLARKFTAHSEIRNLGSPFAATEESRLNPKSESFRARDWAKSFYNLRYSSDDALPRVAGVALRDLNVWGKGSPTDFQSTVGNNILKLPSIFGQGTEKIDILQHVDGLLLPGEQLCVLGPPGSGCSTLLKTIAGETHGFQVNPDSCINYQGVSAKEMSTTFKGEAIYTAEVDAHFPQLSVGDTLYFAARARAPRQLPEGLSSHQYAEHLRDVVMAMLGISHTVNTRVGDEYLRGVSGGERKRVTIAEATLSFAPLQCWDNSTRGLDSANAVEFCRTLRTQCDIFGVSTCVAIYQAPQAAYEVFDKVTVLYEGRQIYFGPAGEARAYFENLGFECPESQTTPDFLTSMTAPSERRIRTGFENATPRTADDFARCWKESAARKQLISDIERYNTEHPIAGSDYEKFALSRKLEKSKRQRTNSPYTLSYMGQIKLCMWREWQKFKNDPSIFIAMLTMNFFEALIIASIFYNLPKTTGAFFSRGAVVFMGVLLNAFASIVEIMSMYSKRTIVEKHNRYALYHPSAEALSSIIMDMPYKVINSTLVNCTLYFMANLRREPGPFFFFWLVSFAMLVAMSMLFRLLASMSKSIEQALAPASLLLMLIILYTGFVIPVEYMKGWAGWTRWLNPVSYGFESAMVNEFHNRTFECSAYVPSGPSYENISANQRVCSAQGSQPGVDFVSGTAFVDVAYDYQWVNRWRNWGIIVVLTIALLVAHLFMTEYVAAARSKGEVLVFRRSTMKNRPKRNQNDEESGSNAVFKGETSSASSNSDLQVQKQSSIFHWEDVNYEIDIKGEKRKILDSVDGWIKPGTLTALMGVSGAGKTTLLDVLASRTTMGVISGNIFVDGHVRDASFQRKTGYAMQQDIHLATSTVREALEFSAILRQPPEYTRAEKLAYVDQVISILDMEEYADAVVGVPGSGLNVEQRKRLTIGVELAARPKLLLFLDEPTSGLDSQTSWSICDLMEKLTRNGQAILCTIHQPSSLLFQRFDRLLLLAKGGRTVYFGDIGQHSRILLDYFARNGGPAYDTTENPAEYMLAAIGAAPGTETSIDWPGVWRSSPEYTDMQTELGRLRALEESRRGSEPQSTDGSHQAFAASMATQLKTVALRCGQQYWRSPSYIYSKILLIVGSAIIISFSFFNADNTQQGLQNQMFGVFIFLFAFIQMMFQVIPIFIKQRTLYEARERQSKTYAWQAFIISNIVIEMAWNALIGVICFLVWYYPMGLYRNAEATNSTHIRAFHSFIVILGAFFFSSTLSHMTLAGTPNEEIASGIVTLLSIFLYAFCGVLAGPDALPRFWIFMYRANPFTYIVSSLLSATMGMAPAHCAESEFVTFEAPGGESCSEYMREYIGFAGGYLRDANAMDQCHYCHLESTDQFLRSVNVKWETRWRDLGLIWVYVGVNVLGALLFYWLCRVPKGKKRKSG